jgi:hypothetical protein
LYVIIAKILDNKSSTYSCATVLSANIAVSRVDKNSVLKPASVKVYFNVPRFSGFLLLIADKKFYKVSKF